MEVTIKSETRPCVTRDGRKALWHGFAGCYAIVETGDGSVDLLMAPEIAFADSDRKFEGVSWGRWDA